MGRNKSRFWECFRAVSFAKTNASDKASTMYICKYCGDRYHNNNATRMKNHDIKCKRIPIALKQNLGIDNDATNAPLAARPCEVFSKKRKAATDIGNFMDHMIPEEQEKANRLPSRAIYVSGASLSMLEKPCWQRSFVFLRPAFKLPSRKVLSGADLEEEFRNLKKIVEKKVKSADSLHLQIDGWSNLRNEGISNVVITTPEPLFFKFIDIGSQSHDAEYLTTVITEIFDAFKEKQFFSVIGDNAFPLQAAFNILKAKFGVDPLRCICHSLHLLVGDVLKIQKVSDLLEEVLKVVNTFRKSQALKAFLSEISNKTLETPVKTRWASHLTALNSLKANKEQLQQLCITEKVTKILSMNKNLEVKKHVLDDDFWKKIDCLICVLQPMAKWITTFESDKPQIHKVNGAINEIEKEMSEVNNVLFNENIVHLSVNRRQNFIQPIHYAAVLLDPRNTGCSLQPDEALHAIEFIDTIATKSRLVNATEVRKNLRDYRKKTEGIWSRKFLWNQAQILTPLEWWDLVDSELSIIAKDILSAPCTSAATERTFSRFSFIHSKRRNKLTVERVGKISFISLNNRHLSDEFPPRKKSRYEDDEDVEVVNVPDGEQDVSESEDDLDNWKEEWLESDFDNSDEDDSDDNNNNKNNNNDLLG